MKFFVLISCLIFTFSSVAQVGINTTSPSAASVLDISSSSDGLNFGGFMPPRVSLSERDLILPTAADEGLMVYVINPPNSQLQIWDGSAWQTMFPRNIELSTILAAWEVNGVHLIQGFGPSLFNTTTSHSGVTVGGLTRSSGLTDTGTAANNAWGASGWYFAALTQNQTAAIVNNKFITFSITPNFGVKLSITAIESYNIRRTSTGPQTGIWQYSINGGAFIDIGGPIIWGGIIGNPGNPQAAIDLSAIVDLQNLTSSTTVTFRIVNWDADIDPSIHNNNKTWYINNIAGNDLVIRGNLTQ